MQRSSYFVNTARIIFVTNCFIAPENTFDIFKFLQFFGSLNNLLILDEPEPRLCLYDIFKKQQNITNVRVSTTNVSDLFPDKLKDMHGYQYKVLLIPQPPRVAINYEGTDFNGIDVEIMKTIAAIQNAGLKMELAVGSNSSVKIKLFTTALKNQLIDLTFNTLFTARTNVLRNYINTYDQNGYCAIIPIPPTAFIFAFPLDTFRWAVVDIHDCHCYRLWCRLVYSKLHMG